MLQWGKTGILEGDTNDEYCMRGTSYEINEFIKVPKGVSCAE